MSSDIYIPLWNALSQPGHFQFKAELNVDVETARLEAATAQPDWWHVNDCLKPVLLCKFGARETWRHVDIVENEWEQYDLHISCAGSFRVWLMEWLKDHNYQYVII